MGRADYEALWRCSADRGWLAHVHEQLWAWLKDRKSIDIDVTQTFGEARSVDGTRELTVANHVTPSERVLRAELVERTRVTGTWTTELIAFEGVDGRGWLSLVVRNDEGRYVAVPRLARDLLEVLPLSDGALSPGATAAVVRLSGVDDLVAALLAPDRQGLLFVAGTARDGLPFDPFVRKVSEWTSEVVGLAQVVVLDPDATHELAERLDPLHVPEWTIRTYYPVLDPEDLTEIHRHRVLGTSALGRLSDPRIRKLLGTVARGHTHRREWSTEVTKVRRQFQRLRNRQLVEAVGAGADIIGRPTTSTPPSELPTVGVAQANTTLELVRNILGLSVVDEESLRRIRAEVDRKAIVSKAVDDLEARIESIQTAADVREDELRKLGADYEDAQLETWISGEENGKLREEVRWLRARLRDAQDFEAAFGELPDEARTAYPNGYADLVEKLRELAPAGVSLTADEGMILDLVNHDQLNQCLRNIWDAALMLVDYKRAVDAGDATKGMKHYLEHTPTGYRNIAPGKFAPTETTATMAQFGHLRIFPVPTSVDPRGQAVMKAHVKLARIGMISPRMYFLDDLTNSGAIVIGYIGPHLQNTHTN